MHRALSSLVRAGLAGKESRGQYILGDEFLRLAFAHYDVRPESIRIRPLLETLAARFGETAQYAVLVGDDIEYRAKVDPECGAVRLTSTVGGRNPAHSTGVGKAILAGTLPDLDAVERWGGDRVLERRTPRTATTAHELHERLAETRERGYAIDDQENELGVNCVAFAVHLGSPGVASGAVSVSAVAYRTPSPTWKKRSPTSAPSPPPRGSPHDLRRPRRHGAHVAWTLEPDLLDLRTVEQGL